MTRSASRLTRAADAPPPAHPSPEPRRAPAPAPPAPLLHPLQLQFSIGVQVHTASFYCLLAIAQH